MDRQTHYGLSEMTRSAIFTLTSAILSMSAAWGCTDNSTDNAKNTSNVTGVGGKKAGTGGKRIGTAGKYGTFKNIDTQQAGNDPSGAGGNAAVKASSGDGSDTESIAGKGARERGTSGYGSMGGNGGNNSDTKPCINKGDNEWVCLNKVLYLCNGKSDIKEASYTCDSEAKCQAAATLGVKCKEQECKSGEYLCTAAVLTKCDASGKWETDATNQVKCSNICNDTNKNCAACKSDDKECAACSTCVINGTTTGNKCPAGTDCASMPAVSIETYITGGCYFVTLNPAYRMVMDVEWDPLAIPKNQVNVVIGTSRDDVIKNTLDLSWYCSWTSSDNTNTCIGKNIYEWNDTRVLAFGGVSGGLNQSPCMPIQDTLETDGEKILAYGTSCNNPRIKLTVTKKSNVSN